MDRPAQKTITIKKQRSISNLSDKTEYKALSILAQLAKQFERLHYLDMTKMDDSDATLARNLLEGIVNPMGTKLI